MTGKIFLKLIAGVFCLLLLALVTVDYFATSVAKDNYIQNLTGQLADKGRMLALSFGATETPDAGRVRSMARAAGGPVARSPVTAARPVTAAMPATAGSAATA